MSDLISIITTLYNYKQYICDLIESVLKQTHTNWELIIVDDASTDNPIDVIKPYLKDKRIKYIRFSKNKGYSVAKNEGIIASQGEYIVMIDADDMLTEKSLEVRYNLLKSNPDKLWCHGEAFVTNITGQMRSESSRKWKQNFRKQISKEIDLTKTYHHRLIHAQGVMLRKDLHRKIGLYDEKLRCSSDNEMWRRAIKFGHVPAYTNEFVSIYRVHSARMSRSEWKNKIRREVKSYIINVVERRFKEGINKFNTRLLGT